MDNQIPDSAKVNVDAKYDRPIWYLAGPFYRYAEDVKKLARQRGIRIIDALVTDDRTAECQDPPTVTLLPQYAPKAGPAVEAPVVEATPKAASGKGKS